TGAWQPRHEIRSTNDGLFTSDSLEPGTYRLEVRADGWVSEFHPDAATVEEAQDIVLTSPGTYQVYPELRRGARVLGGRLTVRGEPVRVADVMVSQVRDDGSLASGSTAVTDEDGAWSVRVDPGRYQVRFGRELPAADPVWLGTGGTR